MRLRHLHLENYVNIYNGLGLSSIDIDFTKCSHKLLVIKGDNGSGKSSIIKTIHPFMDDSTVFIPDKDVKKFISYFLNDGTILDITYTAYKGVNTKSKPSRCSIIRKYPNGESYELNENGNINSGKEIIFDLLDMSDDYIVLSSISATNKGLGDMIPSERKKYVGNIMSAISDYSNMYKLFTAKSTVLKSLLKTVSVKLSQIGSIELVKSSIVTNSKSLSELLEKKEELSKKYAEIKVKIDNISKDGVNPLQELNGYIEQRKELERNISDIPEEYINKYTEEYMIELTEKNAKLSSNYETLNERANELLNKEKSIRNSITSNEIKLQSLFNKDIFEQTKKNIEIKDKQVKFFEDRFKSIGFTKYDSISESEYNMVLSSIERYNNIIDFIADNFSYSIRENVFSGMDNNDYASAKESISREIDDLGVELEVQSRLKERASKFDMVPKNCNNIKTCVFIKDIVDAKSELLPDEDILKKENRLEELKESYEKTEKLIQDQQSMILCRQKVDDLVAIVSPVEKLSKLFTDRMCLKDIKYNVINLVKIDIDLSKYQEYSNYITSIKSYKEDIKILKEELEKMMGSSKESITLKAIIEKENEELQEVLDSKVAIISKIGTIKDEYLRIKREYETIGTAKAYKEKYSKYSEELVDIQNKIDSIMSNAKDYKELSNIAIDVSTELNNLNSKDIPILQNEIEKAKYKVVLYEQYKKDYAEYQDKFDKLQMLKKYSGINGIQTVYMGVYMNSILQEANNLLSLLFRGRFRLQPFIINEKEFILPCIDDNGNIRPDISLMSDSQLSEISMIISFVLLHKASNKYNIIKLDEVDDNLDNENRLQFTILIDKIMSLLNFEQCIIISHNNEIDLSDTDLIVTKIEDSEQHRSIISNSNVIADFS